jgi:hypothetical protein
MDDQCSRERCDIQILLDQHSLGSAMGSGVFHKSFWLVFAAALCAAGMWTYADRVLIPYQKADADAHQRPRGNLSDLYPRWLGARELLLHGRDPYGADVTREIQAGYYGRALDSSRPNDPRDEQGFAYPVYVVFFLAPTIGLPFPIVQKAFLWILIGLTVVSVPLWLRVLRWSVPPLIQISLVALVLGSLAVMQGLKLQQMSVLVAGLIAIAIVLLVTDHGLAAGFFLALASMKPQFVFLLFLWLAIWTAGDWRRRYRWSVSFLVTTAVLIAASEWYLPHWIPRFWHAVREYQRYTGAFSVMDSLIGAPWSHVVELFAFAATMGVCWRERRRSANTDSFAFTISLVLATTLLLVPTCSPNYQMLLIPACLVLAKERGKIWQSNIANRILLLIAIAVISWTWISSTTLAGLSFVLPRETVERGWAIPFWTVTLIPVGVAALMFVHYYQKTFSTSAGPGSS